jgi:hypothetical protein
MVTVPTVVVVGFLALLVVGGFSAAAEGRNRAERIGTAIGVALFAAMAYGWVTSI